MTEIENLIKEFEANPLVWGMVYCPHHFRSKSPPFHLKILKESMTNRYLAVAAPRESAKSTILSFLKPAHSIAFKKKRHIVILQNTYAKAASSLATIKKEFKENERVQKAYSIQIPKDSEGDSIFRHPDGFETRVLCKGLEQMGTIRGEKFGAYRPDLIIIDDLEDDKMVLNPELRRELQEVFDQAVIPAGDREQCDYIVVGTILHDDSQMAKLVSKDQYREFRKLLFRARWKNTLTGELSSLWKEKWTVEQLNDMEKHKPDTFAKELQNDPVSGMQQKFHREDFRYWTIENMQYVLFGREGEIVARGDLADCKAAIATDLAWEEKKASDFSVILPGFLTPNSDILLDDYVCKKGMRPDEMAEILFSMESRLRAVTGQGIPIGFEKAKLEKVAQWFLKREMRKRNRVLLTRPVEWTGDKNERIVTKLQPRYIQHMIYHKRGMGDYEAQLLRVPHGTHDDLPDAAQGLVQLLQFPKGPRKVVQSDTEFDWWRKLAIDAKKPPSKRILYKPPTKYFKLPTTISYR